MDIIPVLDLRAGVVVHAQHGERASYAPLRTPLIATCDPVDVLAAMLAAAARANHRRPPPAAYLADLDGIVQGAPQWALLRRLRDAAPVPLWLDAGFASAAAALEAAQRGFLPVLGSESLGSIDALPTLQDTLTDSSWILSLDADASGPRDPAGVLQHPDLWPLTVIAMDLTRVGSGAGGVGDWLARCMVMAPERRWIAAGGVRGRDDLRMLKTVGVAGALVATALHQGALAPTQAEAGAAASRASAASKA
ncbi:MAG: nickel transporter [Rhodocyclaceae bacterium]|nr:nickel transporter [Rhodocyclaceae bacterium]